MASEQPDRPTPLVSKRDVVVEDFLNQVFDSLTIPLHTSPSELARQWKEEVKEKISNHSIVLSHRTSPLVDILLEQKVKQVLNSTFVKVQSSEPDFKTMVENYNKCFDAWVDNESCVSFKAYNKNLLGNLSAKDAWILTFFAFCTNQRTQGDNLLQLGLTGCSTSGKSTLFESILIEGAHITTSEAGVGRYNVGSKPVLMFHDIPVSTLVSGKDVEKIKTIARTEPTVAKVHSSTEPLPPLFLFYSSNERLLTHEFHPDKTKPLMNWRHYGSQAVKPGQKRISQEHVTAVQNRFIEVFVRQRPQLEIQYLPTSGGFKRMHGVLGMFERILAILSKYESKDFHSPYLYLYALKALSRYSSLYEITMERKDIKNLIYNQVFKLVKPDLIDDITQDL